MYINSRSCIHTVDGYSDTFDILTGVRQGYILSSFLFLIIMDFIMKKSVSSTQYGIGWKTVRLTDLDFADDIAMISHSSDIMQHMTDDLHHNALKVGLRISCEKTKVMSVGDTAVPQIQVGQQLLECVADFQYLGSYISSQCDPESDIRARLGKAASVFQRLGPIWSRKSISNNVKFRLYASVVLSTALHACETWKSTAEICNT